MKIFVNILLALFIVQLHAVYSQTLICDSNVIFKRGIYRTFEEFRNNNPSLDTIQFTVDSINKEYGFMNLNRHISYRLVLSNSASLTKEDSIWGFCDGNKIYYNKSQIYRKKNLYDEILYLGRYCIFDCIEKRQMVTPVTTGGGTTMYTSSNYNVLVAMVININNGLVFELNKKNMKKVLSIDELMLDDFKEETQKNKVLKEYLIEFSETHRDKIKRD